MFSHSCLSCAVRSFGATGLSAPGSLSVEGTVAKSSSCGSASSAASLLPGTAAQTWGRTFPCKFNNMRYPPKTVVICKRLEESVLSSFLKDPRPQLDCARRPSRPGALGCLTSCFPRLQCFHHQSSGTASKTVPVVTGPILFVSQLFILLSSPKDNAC